jgi:hypothetical protein
MKIRTLIVVILGVLVVSGALPAQEAGAPEQEPQELAFRESDSPEPQPESASEGPAAPASESPVSRSPRRYAKPVARTPTSESPTKLIIFELRHIPAEELANVIMSVFRIEVYPDNRSNRLIVNATEEQMEGVESLVKAMDVPGPEASTPRQIQNLAYRVYMFEIPSGSRGMRSFSMILQTSAHVTSRELSVAAADKDLQISEYLHINHGLSEPQAEILIRGKAASDESFKRFFEKFPESHITELKWDDDETFTDNIATAQFTQLPEQMQTHVRKFLGDDIRTVGYWFGNSSSVPGAVQAPIGPWTLKLQLNAASDRTLELTVDVEVPGQRHPLNRRLGHQRNDKILANSIRAKMGKPIIIGYNRESYGTRKMGAMVIVPEAEADSLGSDTAETSVF